MNSTTVSEIPSRLGTRKRTVIDEYIPFHASLPGWEPFGGRGDLLSGMSAEISGEIALLAGVEAYRGIAKLQYAQAEQRWVKESAKRHRRAARNPVTHPGPREHQRCGEYTFRHPNGTLMVSGHYRNGRRHGEWRWWYDTGTLSEVAWYSRGVHVGDVCTWTPEGVMTSRTRYNRNGKLHGVEWSLDTRGGVFQTTFSTGMVIGQAYTLP